MELTYLLEDMKMQDTVARRQLHWITIPPAADGSLCPEPLKVMDERPHLLCKVGIICKCGRRPGLSGEEWAHLASSLVLSQTWLCLFGQVIELFWPKFPISKMRVRDRDIISKALSTVVFYSSIESKKTYALFCTLDHYLPSTFLPSLLPFLPLRPSQQSHHVPFSLWFHFRISKIFPSLKILVTMMCSLQLSPLLLSRKRLVKSEFKFVVSEEQSGCWYRTASHGTVLGQFPCMSWAVAPHKVYEHTASLSPLKWFLRMRISLKSP